VIKESILASGKPPTAALSCPLDVHSGNVARKLELLSRNKKRRKKALSELDEPVFSTKKIQ
jgi:hypothetical protein